MWPKASAGMPRSPGQLYCPLFQQNQDSHTQLIGINVNIDEFPEEIRDTATSLKLELGKSIKRSPVIRAVAEAFETYYDIFLETCDMSRLKEDYNRELANTGREVLVLDPRGQYEGTALGIIGSHEHGV